jgi:DNA-binding XRE family transcriptional regulator
MKGISDLDTFGELLRAFRKRCGLTQQQVANGIGDASQCHQSLGTTQETRTALERIIEQMRLAQQAEDAVAPETATPELERDVPCAFGCGRVIESSQGRGKPRRFFSRARKQRFYRNTLRQKRNADSVEMTTLRV